jgi:hypothetical protein
MKKLIVLVMMMLSITASVLATGAGSDIVYVDDSTNIVLSLVNQNPNPANAGEILTAYMGLENEGSKLAKDVVVEFIPSYPFTLASGEASIQQIGSIGAYQGVDGESIKIVDFKVKVDKDASAGTYALKFKYYNANQDYVFEKSVNIEIEGEQSAEVIRIDKTILIPGKESTIKFTLSNVGNSPLRNMVFHWENEDDIILPVGSDNTKYISYLDVADSADLEYNVIADTNADAGLYKLNLYLTYDDGSGDEDEINTVAGIYVGGETDFEVVFSDNSGGQMSFSIANTGSNPADSISVVIPEQIGWSVIGSNSAIIGT